MHPRLAFPNIPEPNSRMPTDFSGKWVFDHADNMEAIAEAFKVDKSKLPSDKSATTEITQKGDNFTIKTVTAVRTREVGIFWYNTRKQGRIQNIHGGGGAQKVMCQHAHYERGTELTFGRDTGPA